MHSWIIAAVSNNLFISFFFFFLFTEISNTVLSSVLNIKEKAMLKYTKIATSYCAMSNTAWQVLY